MAKAKIGPAGIEYIQGALLKPKKVDGHNHGNYLIATHRSAPTQNPDGCQRLYTRNADTYKRTTPLSAKEQTVRTRFTEVAAMVKARQGDLSKISADQEAFEAQRYSSTGKRTMRAYLWAICGAEYDAQHPQG
ncbi:MAG: hypothetical protein J6M55_00600 [Paludibacteraceae bacterium]|nr:hypothetical protein [Paludibacteraceae bacterium]